MNYYAHHIGDFIRDTSRLTDQQTIAYLRMLWMYYETETPFENDADAIAFKIGANASEVHQILKYFFFSHDGMWHHSRCDKEILAFRGKSEKAKKSADARWNNANAMRPQCERNANASKTHASTMLTNNQEPITIKSNTLSGKPDESSVSHKSEAVEILEFLNTKTGRGYRPVKANIEMIIARLKEGATVADCRQVIAKKTREWGTDEKMEQYLRPKTIFNRTNFANYVGELGNG